MRVVLIPAGVVIALAVVACGAAWQQLGPTPADQGVVIYLHADFVGPSQAMNVDVPNLGLVEGPCSSGAEGEVPAWADCISSVKVLPGWSATLYKDPNYKGASVTVTSDTPNLKDLRGSCNKDTFNDCVSSIRVAKQ